MSKSFLLYGANGFVGSEAARLAVKEGLRPILAGRSEEKLRHLTLAFQSIGPSGLPPGTQRTMFEMIPYVSTGIPNIESYLVLSPSMKKGMAFLGILTPLFQYRSVRNFFKRGVKPGPSMEECEMSTTHVWGEVRDDNGQKAVALLHGPEGGLVWTSKTANAAVHEVLKGNVSAGYQTPATAFGPEFVLESAGVSLEDL